MFQESFMEEEVSRMLNDVTCFSMVFHDFHGCLIIFTGVPRVFQGSFKKTLKVFQKSFMCMALIAASRPEGGLVFLHIKIMRIKEYWCVVRIDGHRRPTLRAAYYAAREAFIDD